MTYRHLLKILPTLSEDELWGLLAEERRKLRRYSMLYRLHQRASNLRMQRERLEILREARVR